MKLGERTGTRQSFHLGKRSTGDAVCFESDQLTGHADYTGTVSRLLSELDTWGSPQLHGRVVVVRRASPKGKRHIASDATYSSCMPLLGEDSEIGPTVAELVSAAQTMVAEAMAKAIATAPTPTVSVVDTTTMLRQARETAGLPVQDLATMFGVKRRQFYNLLNGADQATPERERRIELVTRAIERLSDGLNGDSRTVRTALLAELQGDSVFAAASADDSGRLDAAINRAVEAVQLGQRLKRLTPPSHRADREAASSAREQIASSRDQMGYDRDEP